MFTVGLIQVLLEVISWLDSYCSCIRSTALDSRENVCLCVYFYEMLLYVDTSNPWYGFTNDKNVSFDISIRTIC